tara:strand:- start:597 stop:1439 length:843 start_codon:yes stop_codon:yes gene_type:complete
MEPSRDDFIIAIRSAFLKKGIKQRFSLFALITISLILIIFSKYNFKLINYIKIGINEIVYRGSYIASAPKNYLDTKYFEINQHFNLYQNYKLLSEDFNILVKKKYDTEFLISENKRLKKVIDEINYSSTEIIAKVLVDKQSPFLRSIVINKGTKNNIEKGMAVVSDYHLIGKVEEVNYGTSRVLLLSDLNSKIPVLIEPEGIKAILSGSGESLGEIEYQKDKLPISNDSIVYTSGSGGILKAGIPIGKIKNDNEKINVNFFKDFNQIGFVKILSHFEEKN